MIVLYVVFGAVLVSAAVMVRALWVNWRASEAERMGEALTPERYVCSGCQRTFSSADARWTHWQVSGDCDGGGFGDQAYGPEIDALYASEQGEAEVRAETMP